MIKHPTSDSEVSFRIIITCVIMLIIAALVGSGCVSSREHAMKAKTNDLIQELRYRGLVTDSTLKIPVIFNYDVKVPGFVLKTKVNPLIRQGDTVRVRDSSTSSELKYWINRAGQLEIECAQRERTIYKTDTLYKEVPIPVVVEAPIPWYETNYFAAIVTAVAVLFIVWAVNKAGGKPPNVPPTPLVMPLKPA